VLGADRVARFLLGLPRLLPEAQVAPTITADGLAFLVTVDGAADSVMSLGVSGGRVTDVYIVRNPEKLTLWRG
jgi:RNA polymerase sigma-70 factor (ECF subfamily)